MQKTIGFLCIGISLLGVGVFSAPIPVFHRDGCDVREVKYIVSGESMSPRIRNGQALTVLEGYYVCNPLVKRGDIVIYEADPKKDPLIKQIRALPGDSIRFENRKLRLNGEYLKNSTGNAYVFSENEIRLLSAYLQDHKLPSGIFFAFGDNLINSLDSRKIGGFDISHMKGKVVENEK